MWADLPPCGQTRLCVGKLAPCEQTCLHVGRPVSSEQTRFDVGKQTVLFLADETVYKRLTMQAPWEGSQTTAA
ncbi:hypothetical protein AN477_17455 [Alicyclobacillus ferrooxydans]|uniref:Uncharacterized protein n=1 Tax=Alicyclobacillus ferrooxydans TaxID=471514 RepID=A0A0P9CAI2_9BACL|nr:hypothetical protein AN477_17455 [Alicyclobacillus ferrooxydans]